MTRGLVLGKFLPPHAGHLYLIDFAQRFVDELTVVVGTLAREPIPGSLRFLWMKELAPSARVVHLEDENPQEPSEHPDFWTIWKESLLRVVGPSPDYVFASEAYGARLAAELGARFIPVDLSRGAFPVSGTAIRRDPASYWSFLPPPVRAFYAKRISVFGPESAGKTTLTRELAKAWNTKWVPEYARTWLEQARQPPDVTKDDLMVAVRGQIASEDALARQAGALLFCDTDPMATTLWSEELFGDVPPALVDAASGRSYALTLLCEPDLPFVPDPIRYRPDSRASFFEKCVLLLERERRPYVRIGGEGALRLARATAAVRNALFEGAAP